MLDHLYNETITIKYNRSGDKFTGYTYSTKTILAAISHKQKNVLKNDSQKVSSSSVLLTKELLDINDLISYNGKDSQILEIFAVKNHFDGGIIDHYEVLF